MQDLPYKIELNQWGNIEMSRVGNRHGEFQDEIGYQLRVRMPGGICTAECGVHTAENTKVPDVTWVSLERHRATPHEFAYAVAPEICVEILSLTNMLEEQMHKGRLYLQAGAREFWLCDARGTMRFFDANGELERSALCPEFPVRVEIPD